MKQAVINEFIEKRSDLEAKQKVYDFSSEQKEIDSLELKMNALLQTRNSKKQISDGYQVEIDKIDETIQAINELIEETDVETGIEHPIEKED